MQIQGATPNLDRPDVLEVLKERLRRDLAGLARAVALGRYAGLRRQTICALPLSARVLTRSADGSEHIRLLWITEKRKAACDKREDPRLTALLESTPDHGPAVAYNDRGQPFRERGLNQSLQTEFCSVWPRPEKFEPASMRRVSSPAHWISTAYGMRAVTKSLRRADPTPKS